MATSLQQSSAAHNLSVRETPEFFFNSTIEAAALTSSFHHNSLTHPTTVASLHNELNKHRPQLVLYLCV